MEEREDYGMKRGFWIRFRANRLVVIFIAIIVYSALALTDGEQTFSHPAALYNFVVPIWLSFGFSLSVALIFLAVGSLTWFYSRDRQVSLLLFIFSCVVMVPFELETASSISLPDARLPNIMSSIASSVALTLLAAILLVFPKNHFTSSTMLSRKWLHNVRLTIFSSVVGWYIFLLILSLCLAIIDGIVVYTAYPRMAPGWLDVASSLADIVVLTGSIATIIILFRKSTTREREQLRFFVSGVILHFCY